MSAPVRHINELYRSMASVAMLKGQTVSVTYIRRA
jgi:hypothetical protein